VIKTKLAAGLMAMVLVLGACNAPVRPISNDFVSTPLDTRVRSVAGGSSYSDLGIWIDPKYGCQYFTGEVKLGIFMTPRIASDRLPLCDHGKSLTDQPDEREQYEALKKKFEGQ
jgi:hypothetical protein